MNISPKGVIDLDLVKYISAADVNDTDYLHPNDVLFNNTNSPVWVGKTALVTQDAGWLFSNHMTRIRVSPTHISPKWLATWLHWLFRQGFFQANCKNHVNQASINAEFLKRETPILLAPLPIQQQIVDRLDAHFSRLDAAEAALRRVQANLKRYRAAVLQAACSGRLVATEAVVARAEGRSYEPAAVLLARVLAERRTAWQKANPGKSYKEPRAPATEGLAALPEGWVWATVEQVGEVSGGITKNARRGTFELNLPYLRVANVYSDRLDLGEVSTIGMQPQELERVLLRKDDLLIVEGNGSLEQIGRVALWDAQIEPCVHQNHLIKVRATAVVYSRYLLYWLLSPGGRVQIVETASSTSGLHTLSLSKVNDLVVPIPPLAEQVRIVNEVQERMTVLNATSVTSDMAVKKQAALRQAVLGEAFGGTP